LDAQGGEEKSTVISRRTGFEDAQDRYVSRVGASSLAAEAFPGTPPVRRREASLDVIDRR